MSVSGTVLENINDACEKKFSLTKAATKLSIGIISSKLGTSNAFGPTEKIVNSTIFNLLDRSVDEIKKDK